MSLASLLDVNVLIASAYEWHVAHKRAYAWWRESEGEPLGHLSPDASRNGSESSQIRPFLLTL